VPENASPSPLATLSTDDPDSVDSHTYTIVGGNADNHFQIVGDKIELAPSVTLNHEAGNETITRDVIINVVDVNEAPEAQVTAHTALNQITETYQYEFVIPNHSLFIDPDGDSLSYNVT